MTQPAALALDGGDPRASMSGPGIATIAAPVLRNLHDPSVTIEEYFYWAKITREEEKELPKAHHPIKKTLGLGKNDLDPVIPSTVPASEKHKTNTGAVSDGKKDEIGGIANAQDIAVTNEEWMQAARAARTATWGAVFYLITTDVLGPYSVP